MNKIFESKESNTENLPLIQINQKALTSRTAVLTYQTCPRKRFLQFHYNGHGVVPSKLDIDLFVGTCVHRGLQHLLEHCRIEHPSGDFDETCVEDAVLKAKELFYECLSNNTLALKPKEEPFLDFVIKEHWALIEGLIRVYAAFRLPEFLEEYEVLEVEKEDLFYNFSSLVAFQAKADGLLRRKSTNELVVLSYKTAAEFAEVTKKNIFHDMQGLSEIAAIQDRVSNLWEILLANEKSCENRSDWEHYLHTDGNKLNILINSFVDKPKILAVQYEYLIKGKRREESWGSGKYERASFLIHPYKFENFSSPFSNSLNPDEFKWKVNKGRQPKGWEKINIWEEIGVKEWINLLSSGQIQPEEGNPFDKIILFRDLLVYRDEEDIKEWQVSTSYQEDMIATQLGFLEKARKWLGENPDEVNDFSNAFNCTNAQYYEILLQRFFPKHTISCFNYYGHDCPYVEICHGNKNIDELLEADFYSKRIPHHESELNELKEKGLI